MTALNRSAALAGSAAMLLATSVAVADVSVKLEPFVTGLNAPLSMKQPKGDDRIFVIEQWGRVRIIQDGELLASPFLDIRDQIPDLLSDFDERGLLGLAFHPDFKNNGKFYVAHSGHLNSQGDLAKDLWWSHSNVVAEYRVSADDPDVADPKTRRVVSSIDWPQFNHNGHWIDFGPDGMLYISTGDGGYANDWGIGHEPKIGNGQDMTSLHGKILRVDVDGGEPYGVPSDNPHAGDNNARPEIWASGLRNPWRCSFDMGGSNALFCGDVQQNSFEEVSVIEKGGNYGWRVMEAGHCFDYYAPDDHPSSCDKAGLSDPVLEYPNCTAKPDGCLGISVTGGYVYRGSHSAWDGKYIFGDWSKTFAEMNGQIFVASESGGKWTMEVAKVTNMDTVPYILAFAQDANGEVYALTSITTGPVGSLDTIYKIVPAN